MIVLRPRHLLDLLALAFIVLLAAALSRLSVDYYVLLRDQGEVSLPRLEPAGAAPPQAARPQPDPAPALYAYAETLNRPLFEMSRRKAVPEPPPAPAPVPVPPAAPPLAEPREVILIGTLIQSDIRRALVRMAQPGEERWVKEGDEVEGWSVGSITETRIVLLDGQRRFVLDLYRARPE